MCKGVLLGPLWRLLWVRGRTSDAEAVERHGAYEWWLAATRGKRYEYELSSERLLRIDRRR
jgi:hypothetical protein